MFRAVKPLHFMALLALLGSVTACSGDPETTETPTRPQSDIELLGGDCDPIVPEFCGLPFPSNVYLLDDPTGANTSGKSVRFGATTLPARFLDDVHFDPSLLYDHDGFSPSQAPMTHFPMAECSACATPYSIEKSIEPDHPTVLLELPSGRRVPHWVDMDATTTNDGTNDWPDQRLFMIRPAEQLKAGTRYLVAFRDMMNVDGKLVEPSPVFRALRAGKLLEKGTAQEKWTVYARRALYADIFGELEKAGVPRDNLQIAWDYTTATKENITGRMIEMRDKALSVVGDDGPSFVVEKVEENPDPELLRRIHLVVTLPVYLTTASKIYDKDAPVDRLNVDANGQLAQNGTMDWQVLVLVPKSVESGKKHGLLQNGHGLFGSRFEGQGGYLARAANKNQWIAFSTNLFGFDGESVPMAIDGLVGRFDALKAFSERQLQGMVNQLLVMRMMMGRVAKDGIKDGAGQLLLDPAWVDASVRGYRGDSQGGIMGGTYMAISTDVTRGLLGEAGMPYNLLLNRSVDWAGYSLLLEAGFGYHAVNMQLVLGVVQMAWDRSEPAGFFPYIQDDPLPGTPSHQVLLHVARGDHQVTTFGSHLMARTIGAVQLDSDDPSEPVFEDFFGVERAKGPLTNQSAMVEYEFGLKPNPATNKPNMDGCDPHDRVRDLNASFDQQDEFFRTGVISWKCKGACNCNDAVASDPTEEDRCDETQCQ